MPQTPFRAFPLYLSGPVIPGAVLRLVTSHGVMRCDPDAPTTSYQHNQPTPAATWTINHALGKIPNVSAYTVGGREMLGEILHTSLSQTLVYFDSPVAGFAVCD